MRGNIEIEGLKLPGEGGNFIETKLCMFADDTQVFNKSNKLKRARSNENLSETEQETNKRLKKDDIGNELGELKTLMYDLAVEMKDMNDKVFERIDNLENTFAKNIVENMSKMIEYCRKYEQND